MINYMSDLKQNCVTFQGYNKDKWRIGAYLLLCPKFPKCDDSNRENCVTCVWQWSAQPGQSNICLLTPINNNIYMINPDHFWCSSDHLTSYSYNVNSSEIVRWVCFGSCSSVPNSWEMPHLDVSCVIYCPTVLFWCVSVSAWNYEDSTSGRSWVVP
jgi:hypothetical protein